MSDRRRVNWLAALMGGWLLCPTSVPAHHAGTAFDESRTLTVVGTVKEFRWVNPHSWLYLMVPNDKGVMEEWPLEGGAVSILARAGWTPKIMQPGDKVTVTVKPLKTGALGGEFATVTTADGKTYRWAQL